MLLVEAHGLFVVGDRRLTPVVVEAEADVIVADEVHDIVDVVDELIESGPGRSADERRKADHADQPAGRRSALDLLVGDVAPRVLHRLRIRVREHDGSRGRLDRIHRRAIAGVGAIDDDAGLVEALDYPEAEVAEPGVRSFFAPVADTVLDVVGKLDHADAEGLVRIDQVDVVLDRLGSLEMEEHTELAVRLGGSDVGGALDEDKPRVRVDSADPVTKNAKRRPGPLEGADGGARRGGAALDPPVDVLAAQHERTDGVDHNGFIVDAVVIQLGHAKVLPPIAPATNSR